MAEDKSEAANAESASELVHGEPFKAPLRTGEPNALAPVHIHVVPKFFLDLSQFGGPIFPIDCPPARVIDRVATLLIHGPRALDFPPVNPQSNDKFGKLELSPKELEANPAKRGAENAESEGNAQPPKKGD